MKTDLQLQQDVLDELNWEPSIHAAQIGVEVKDGIVTLDGQVDSHMEKWDAERVARRISGVRGLAIEIAVILPANSVRSDADIARTAVNVLQWTSYLPANSTQVTVEKGWVTLTGEVEWEFQRKAASRAVRDLMGVTGVSNEIAIKAKPPQDTAKADIQAVLKRRAALGAEPITVDVDGAKVTLSGTVRTWLDRQLANHAAWATPGVRNVVDHLNVV